MLPRPALDTLRARIATIEAGGRLRWGVLPFGVAALDACLPGGGLARGALHEVAGDADGLVQGAAAALFAAGIVGRAGGQVLWCVTRPGLFAPALSQAGLDPERVIQAEAGDERTVLACCEAGLRHGGLGAVVGEVAELSLTASRRLQLAAEASGSLAIMLRRMWRARDSSALGQPTAAATRWRVTALLSSPLPVPGIGRARWLLELVRCRGGACADVEVEACDAAGRLALPAGLAHGSAPAQAGQHRATA